MYDYMMNCPKCGFSNMFRELIVPYYICKRCRFGEEIWRRYGYRDIEGYHHEFINKLKKIQDDKEVEDMIRGL